MRSDSESHWFFLKMGNQTVKIEMKERVDSFLSIMKASSVAVTPTVSLAESEWIHLCIPPKIVSPKFFKTNFLKLNLKLFN